MQIVCGNGAIAAVFALAACTFSFSSPTRVVVTFDSNGGSECAPLTLTGRKQSLPEPTREGYTFAGWYCDNETFEIKVTNKSLSDGLVLADIVLYAKWKKYFTKSSSNRTAVRNARR